MAPVDGEVTRGGDRRRRHCAVVAGAVCRGDGVRVRVRATAVDETRRGQRRAGPDGEAPRAYACVRVRATSQRRWSGSAWRVGVCGLGRRSTARGRASVCAEQL